MDRIDEAIDGLPVRRLEQIQERIAKRLRSCAACRQDGAIAVAARAKVAGRETRMSLLLCPACIERNRLPEGRAATEEETRP